jgi:xylulokinase
VGARADVQTTILAHDIGTTGDKATLFLADGTILASSFAAYPTRYPKPGWAEQDANDYWSAFCTATRDLLTQSGAESGSIAVIAFSGQMMAALPVDREGAALRPSIIWADQRSTREAAELCARVPPERVYAVTGHRANASYSGAKIMWIRANEPEVFRKTEKFLHAKDFLVLRLTGSFCTDLSDASGMNLLDIVTGEWSEEMLNAAGVPRSLLPDVREATEVVGTVSADAARATGLLRGTPVVIGGGDGACATCGAGVVSESDAYICLGTSAWLATASARPLLDPLMRTNTFCYFRRGLYFPCGSMQAAGGSLAWFAENFADAEERKADAAGVSVYDVLEENARMIGPGSEGLLFLPYLIGERSPWWSPEARACFVGLSLKHGRSHMARAVMEGVAYNMRLIADAFSEQGKSFSRIRMIGGGARSATWRQIFADVLERPVTTLAFLEEATSVGAAIAGGVGIGLFARLEDGVKIIGETGSTLPDSSRSRAYEKYRAAFRRAYEQLVPVFSMLAGE